MARKASKHNLKGTIVSFNISPKGVYEGVLVKGSDSEIVQVNFYPEFGAYIGETLSLKQKINWQVAPDETDKKAPHPVYYLLCYPSGEGEEINLFEEPRPITSTGIVRQLNYALHGEPNGAILDNGDFIHLNPKGFKEAELEIGQEVKVKGVLQPSFLRNRIIEVQSITAVS